MATRLTKKEKQLEQALRSEAIEFSLNPGEELLINVQSHLFRQVFGKKSIKPDIAGGFHGANYQMAMSIITSLVVQIRAEKTIEAIKAGKPIAHRFEWQHSLIADKFEETKRWLIDGST